MLDPENPSSVVNPLADFKRRVELWTWNQEKSDLIAAGGQNKAADLLARFADTTTEWPYRTRITRFPVGEADKVRLRLLVGTSGLNSTLGYFREEREVYCPWPACHQNQVRESTAHFCLDCPSYAELRRQFGSDLGEYCNCGKQPNCAEFFATLGQKDQVLFMMGMPVSGRTPEDEVDALSRSYVHEAYRKRKGALEWRYERGVEDGPDEDEGDEGEESDEEIERTQAPQGGPLRAAFAIQAARGREQRERVNAHNGDVSLVPTRFFPIFEHAHNNSNRHTSPHQGSGSNGHLATERT